jgi:hypothetical protein
VVAEQLRCSLVEGDVAVRIARSFRAFHSAEKGVVGGMPATDVVVEVGKDGEVGPGLVSGAKVGDNG